MNDCERLMLELGGCLQMTKQTERLLTRNTNEVSRLANMSTGRMKRADREAYFKAQRTANDRRDANLQTLRGLRQEQHRLCAALIREHGQSFARDGLIAGVGKILVSLNDIDDVGIIAMRAITKLQQANSELEPFDGLRYWFVFGPWQPTLVDVPPDERPIRRQDLRSALVTIGGKVTDLSTSWRNEITDREKRRDETYESFRKSAASIRDRLPVLVQGDLPFINTDVNDKLTLRRLANEIAQLHVETQSARVWFESVIAERIYEMAALVWQRARPTAGFMN